MILAMSVRAWRVFLLVAVLGGGYLAWSATAVPAVAQDEAEVKPDAGGGNAGGGAEGVKRTRFAWFIESSGVIGLVILLLSIYFVSTVTRLFFELRPQVVAPPDLVAELDGLLQQRQFKEIYGAVKDDSSYLGKVLSTGIAELPNGLAEARDAMERVGESLTVEMEKKISMLAVLGTLGPMIGLLGTLKGMIASFAAIAMGGAQLKADAVAGGISEALLLTLEGVGLSVPAIYFFAVFKNRVSTLSVLTTLQADEFLRHFAHAARSKGPAPGAAPAAAPAARPAKA